MATDPTQAQLGALLGPGPSQFETLMSHLMSSSNEQRSYAESLFNLCEQSLPDALSLKLAHLLSSSPRPEARAMAAVLLRKLLTRDDPYLYPRLFENTQWPRVEVTWEDQQNINKFGRLNNHFHELEDEVKIAKETNENLEDASNRLILFSLEFSGKISTEEMDSKLELSLDKLHVKRLGYDVNEIAID